MNDKDELTTKLLKSRHQQSKFESLSKDSKQGLTTQTLTDDNKSKQHKSYKSPSQRFVIFQANALFREESYGSSLITIYTSKNRFIKRLIQIHIHVTNKTPRPREKERVNIRKVHILTYLVGKKNFDRGGKSTHKIFFLK